MDPTFCPQCGGRIRVMFNLFRCYSGCYVNGMATPIGFPSFWSRYAPAPRFLALTDSSTPEDRVKVSDCVLLIRGVPPASPLIWYGTPLLIPANATVKPTAPADLEARCVKNTTWDRLVGQPIRLTAAEHAELVKHAVKAPDRHYKDWGITQMVCLVRT